MKGKGREEGGVDWNVRREKGKCIEKEIDRKQSRRDLRKRIGECRYSIARFQDKEEDFKFGVEVRQGYRVTGRGYRDLEVLGRSCILVFRIGLVSWQ